VGCVDGLSEGGVVNVAVGASSEFGPNTSKVSRVEIRWLGEGGLASKVGRYGGDSDING
jgi:hypothetical protein